MVRIIATCAMVSACIPMIGAMVTLTHVLTTPPPSTLQTQPCVETPHSGEDCLVTGIIMDHWSSPAGDVPAPCKHVPTFGIFIREEISTMNISPGPGAKTAPTRSLD